MEERKNGFIFLIVGVILGAVAFFLVDKYLLNKDEKVSTNTKTEQKSEQKEETKDETQEDSKNYTIKDLNDIFNRSTYYSSHNNGIATKYGIKRVAEFSKSDDELIDVKFYYVSKNGKVLEPVNWAYYPTTIEQLSPLIENGYAYIYGAYHDERLNLEEIKDLVNNDSYLVIISDHYTIDTGVYDKNLNLVGKSQTVEGGLYYPEDSKNFGEKIVKFEVYDSYFLSAEHYENNRFAIYKYTVENGKLVKTLNEILPEYVECAQCK